MIQKRDGQPAGRSVVSVDLGGTNLRLALVGPDGSILQRLRYPTEVSLGWRMLEEKLVSGINGLVREAASSGVPVRGVGMGVPGLIGRDGHVYSSVNLPFLEGLNIRNLIADALKQPVIVANDANAIAFGEKVFGAGKQYGSFLLLTLGTGIGSGLVLNGRLWSGSNGFAAEFGHATVEPEGILCACGNNGCLEQYASASAIVRGAIDQLATGRGGELASVSPAEITAARIGNAALQGDPLALELFERAGYYLGLAAATCINLLNLDAVILAGGVSASFELLAEPMRREMRRRAFDIMVGGVPVLQGQLGDDAGLLGSAALVADAVSVLNG